MSYAYTGRESLRRALQSPPYGGLVTVPYLLGIVGALEDEVLRLVGLLEVSKIVSEDDAARARNRAAGAQLAALRRKVRLERPELPGLEYPATAESGGYVYFLDSGQAVKIGWAQDVGSRKKELQTASSEPLKLVAFLCCESQKTEREVHERFRPHRKNGEWFRWSDSLYAYVLELRGDHETAALIRERA